MAHGRFQRYDWRDYVNNYFSKLENSFNKKIENSTYRKTNRDTMKIKIFFFPWVHIQGNSRKGFERCRLSCLLHYIHYLSIPSHTNSLDDISLTLFVISPVYPYHTHIAFISALCVFKNLKTTKNNKAREGGGVFGSSKQE